MQANRNVSQGALLILILVMTFALVWGLLSEAANRSNPTMTDTPRPTRNTVIIPNTTRGTPTSTPEMRATESAPLVTETTLTSTQTSADTATPISDQPHPVILTARAYETQFPLPPTITPTITQEASATLEAMPTGDVGETGADALPTMSGDSTATLHPVIETARAFETQFPLPPTMTPQPTTAPTETATLTPEPTQAAPLDFGSPEPTPLDLIAGPQFIRQSFDDAAVVYRLAPAGPEYSDALLARTALVLRARLSAYEHVIVGLALAEGDQPPTIDVLVFDPHDSEAVTALLLRPGMLEFVDFTGITDTASYEGMFIQTRSADDDALAPDESDHQPNPLTAQPFESILSGQVIAEASASEDALIGAWRIDIVFTEAAATALQAHTAAHMGDPMAVVLDNEVLFVPIIQAEFGESAVLTGNYTQAEAESIAYSFNGGVLPLPLELFEVRIIQPAADA
ncbi:MAG: hypothetical protein OHK0046_13010 [Anaerolineae bacterium]